ncbi:hypothetical protein Tco_1441991, partial [Tanacetum coccineum]
KIYEPELTGSTNTSQNSQNVAFVSSNSTNNSNSGTDNTAYGVSAAHTQSNPTSGDNLKQIDPDDLEEMDLQWEMVMLTIRAKRFIKRTGGNLDVNGQRVGFDKSKVKIGGYDWSYQAEEEHLTNYALMAHTSSGSSSNSDSEVDSCSKSCVKAYATLKEQYDSLSSDYKKSQFNLVSYKAASPVVESFVNSSKMLENQEYNTSKYDKGYHAVPPPYTGNFIPFKPDLNNGKKVESNHESADVKNNGDAVEPKTVKKNSFRPPVIEYWNSDDDSEEEFIPNVKDKIVRPSTEKIKFVKFARETVEKSGKINTDGASVNTAVRPVNTAGSKTTVNTVRVKDTTARDRAVVRNPQQKEYKEKRVIDNGCSRHMTRNKCYLTEYEYYDGGFVSFGDGKGRISKKGKIKTRTSDFDNVYFCKELKYNLFSV